MEIKYNYVAAGVVESISNAFTLKGTISNVRVTNVGGTTVTSCLRGGSYKVKWDKKGYFGSGINDGLVNIVYSQDTGASYPTSLVSGVAAGTDGAGGSWDWNIPADFRWVVVVALLRPGFGTRAGPLALTARRPPAGIHRV